MKKFLSTISLILTIVIVFSICPSVIAYDDKDMIEDTITTPFAYPQGVDGFIARLYDLVMGRTYDNDGLNYWKNQLNSGSMTASNIARFFFSCDEYYDKGYSLDQYLAVLYRVFFDREGDSEGLNYWKGKVLNDGMTRRWVLEGFIYSQEWANVCANYRVVCGTNVTPSVSVTRSAGVTNFVNSLYKDILGRTGDADGVTYWCDTLTYMRGSAKTCAQGFFYSPEFSSKFASLSDEQKVDIFYLVFLGRQGEADGRNYWISQLSGKSNSAKLDTLYNGFIDSKEFSDNCQNNGILVNLPSFNAVYNDRQTVTVAVETTGGTIYLTGYYDRDLAECIMDLTNAYRAEKGRSVLPVVSALNKSCTVRASEIAYSFSHTRPNGGKFNTAVSGSGSRAENIAGGYGDCTAKLFMDQWKNSTKHNDSILSTNRNGVGVAVFVLSDSDPYASKTNLRYFVVQQFK